MVTIHTLIAKSHHTMASPPLRLNGNIPLFSDEDLARSSFEQFSELDSLGRCGAAFALIGPETLPEEERGSIGAIKPSGWQISKYDWIDGGYLYNRCHLIAYSLSGENDNELNLITGTRSMNTQGMLPYEEQVASYVKRTGNHVLYRVTPIFEGANLLASGVLMEAESIEDDGAGVLFYVWCYNEEPGITIDHATGQNWADGSISETDNSTEENLGSASKTKGNDAQKDADVRYYVLNTNTKRFHLPDCPSVADIKEKNRQDFEGTRDAAIEMGYKPCGACKP